jgi:hypothetical protein
MAPSVQRRAGAGARAKELPALSVFDAAAK